MSYEMAVARSAVAAGWCAFLILCVLGVIVYKKTNKSCSSSEGFAISVFLALVGAGISCGLTGAYGGRAMTDTPPVVSPDNDARRIVAAVEYVLRSSHARDLVLREKDQ